MRIVLGCEDILRACWKIIWDVDLAGLVVFVVVGEGERGGSRELSYDVGLGTGDSPAEIHHHHERHLVTSDRQDLVWQL